MSIKKKFIYGLLILAVTWLVFFIALNLIFSPSHNRDWEFGQEALPTITYSATSSDIVVENYRNFAWTGVKSAEAKYETRTFNLNDMTGVDVFISHFDEFEGLAHIFLSFGFKNNEHVVVSLETRRELGESFSPLLGILRQFEIIYVVGSEKDIVGVRTGHRNERVYLYPTIASPEQARELFNLLATEINSVYKNPRMYNTLTNNCTNELTRPVEKMSEVDFPLTWKTILPGYFDEVLYELQLINTRASFTEVKSTHFIDNTKVDATKATYSNDLRRALDLHWKSTKTSD